MLPAIFTNQISCILGLTRPFFSGTFHYFITSRLKYLSLGLCAMTFAEIMGRFIKSFNFDKLFRFCLL